MNKYTKSLFIFLHLASSTDFGFLKIPRIKNKYVIGFITIAQCLCVCTYNYYNALDSIKRILMTSTLENVMLVVIVAQVSAEYVINAIVLVLNNRKRSFHHFQMKLQMIDSKLSTKSSSYSMDIKIILSLGLCLLQKALINTAFCFTNPEECVTSWSPNGSIYTVPQIWSYDIVLIVYFFVFYSVYCRLKVLNRLVYVSSGEQVMENLNIFKSIADSLQVVKKYFDILYMLTLSTAMPDLIFTTYIGLLRFKSLGRTGETYLSYTIRTIFNIQNFVLLVLPALASGLVMAAVVELKLILLERLLRERDKNHEPHLQIFLDYVTGRPMRFTVFKVVPLDWSLPVIILNLCIAYQIIIVQFTKLY